MNEHTGKVPLKAYYSSPEDIQKHIPFELEQQFDNLQKNPPPGTCVVACDKFGEALSVFFHRMEKEKLTHMAAIVQSQTHAMAVRLRIKKRLLEKQNMLYPFMILMQPILQYAIKQTTVILLDHCDPL